MQQASRTWSVAVICVWALIPLGCSPGSWFGRGEDRRILDLPNVRDVNPACAGVAIQGDRLDVTSLRALAGCLNANGAIEPMVSLLKDIPDRELEVAVAWLNEDLLLEPDRLLAIEATYEQLKRAGVLPEVWKSLGAQLADPTVALQLIALLNDTYARLKPEQTARLRAWLGWMGSRLSLTAVDEGISGALEVVTHPATIDLESRLGTSVPGTGELLASVVSAVRGWLASILPSGSGPSNGVGASTSELAWVLDELIAPERRLFVLAERTLGSTAREIRGETEERGVDLLLPTFELLAQRPLGVRLGRTLLDPIPPIACMEGGIVLGDPKEFTLGELARAGARGAREFAQQTLPVLLASTQPICQVPASALAPIGVLREVVAAGAIEGSAVALGALRELGWLERVGRVLVGRELDALAPVLRTASVKQLWPELALLAALPSRAQESTLRAWATSAVTPVVSLDGRSPLRVAAELGLEVPIERWLELGRAIEPYLGRPEFRIQPLIEQARATLLINDAHPFIEVGQRLLKRFAEASEGPRWMSLLASSTQSPHLRRSIALVGAMAQDGTLPTLIEAMLAISARWARSAQGTKPAARALAAWQPGGRHRLRAKDLLRRSTLDPSPGASDLQRRCDALDLAYSFRDPGDARFSRELASLLGCLGTAGTASAEWIESLERAPLSAGGARTLLEYPWALATELRSRVGADGIAQVGQRALKPLTDGRADRTLRAVALALSEGLTLPLTPFVREFERAWRAGSMRLAPLLTSLTAWLDQGESAGVLPQLLNQYDALERSRAAEREAVRASVLRRVGVERLRSAIGAIECVVAADDQAKRVEQLVEEFLDAVNGWQLSGDRPKQSYTFEQLKSRLTPVVRLAQAREEQTIGGPFLYALLGATRLFARDPQSSPTVESPYSSAELVRWIESRAAALDVIAWYYPGETRPRARIVSALDRIEQTTLTSDFVVDLPLIAPRNAALEYLMMIAESWGDEPPARWPVEIQRKYQDATACNTPRAQGCPNRLEQTYRAMLERQQMFAKLVGYPAPPSCARLERVDRDPSREREGGSGSWPKPDSRYWRGLLGSLLPKQLLSVRAGLFNTAQVLGVLGENLPGADHPSAGGMRVLRDLLWIIHRTTEPEFRRDDAEWNNHLSAAIAVSRLGLMRGLTRGLQGFAPGDPRVGSVVASVIAGSLDPRLTRLAERLMWEPEAERVLWAGLELATSALGSADPKDRQGVLDLAFGLSDLLGPARANVLTPALGQALGWIDRELSADPERLARSLPALRLLLASHALGSVVETVSRDYAGAAGGGARSPSVASQAVMALMREWATAPEPLWLAASSWVRLHETMTISHEIDGWVRSWERLSRSSEWNRLDTAGLGRDAIDFLLEPGLGTQVRRMAIDRIRPRPRADAPDGRASELESLLVASAKLGAGAGDVDLGRGLAITGDWVRRGSLPRYLERICRALALDCRLPPTGGDVTLGP